MHKSLAVVDEMYLEGLEMKRAQIRRDRPDLGDEDIENDEEPKLHVPQSVPGKVDPINYAKTGVLSSTPSVADVVDWWTKSHVANI